VVKVASEADFILDRMRADDIRKASEFQLFTQQTTLERRDAEYQCHHFIRSSRQRHVLLASRYQQKYLSLMLNNKQAYLNSSCSYWQLDLWEDDLRRRRRLIRNTNGKEYHEDTFNSFVNDRTQDTISQEEYLLKQSKSQQQQQQQQQQKTSTNYGDDEDLLQIDEKDFDYDQSAPIRYSASCTLICGTIALQGTLAMTNTAMIFDVDNDNEHVRQCNNEVKLIAIVIMSIYRLCLDTRLCG
jgi:hypothetical protein